MAFMDTAVYYGYSTVAQVLAGAFGFLVAVVLYQMGQIRENALTYLNRRSSIQSNMQHGTTDALTASYHNANALVEAEYERLGGVKQRLRWALYWTAGTVIACLVLMPLTPLFSGRGLWVPWGVLCGVVGAAVYTLTTYVRLALEITK